MLSLEELGTGYLHRKIQVPAQMAYAVDYTHASVYGVFNLIQVENRTAALPD